MGKVTSTDNYYSCGFKYRIYPTAEQRDALELAFAASSFVYDRLVDVMEDHYEHHLKWYYDKRAEIKKSHNSLIEEIKNAAIAEGRMTDDGKAALNAKEKACVKKHEAKRDKELKDYREENKDKLTYLNPRKLAFVKTLASTTFDNQGEPWLRYVTKDSQGNELPSYITKRKLNPKTATTGKADVNGMRFLAVSQAALNTAVNHLNQAYSNLYKRPDHFGAPKKKINEKKYDSIVNRLAKAGRSTDDRSIYEEDCKSHRQSISIQIQDPNRARARERKTTAVPVLELFTDDSYRRISIPGVFGTLKIKTHRLPKGECGRATISRDIDGTWYLSLACVRIEKDAFQIARNQEMAYEIGIAHYLVQSDLKELPHPGKLKELQDKIDLASSELSRKKGGRNLPVLDEDGNPVLIKSGDNAGQPLMRKGPRSKNYWKQNKKLRKLQAKQRRCRAYNLHNLTSSITRDTNTIIIRDNKIKELVKNEESRLKKLEKEHKDDPGYTAPGRLIFRQHEKNLHRAMHDSAFAEFRRQIEYKAEWKDRTVLPVPNSVATTQTCSMCGYKNKELAGIKGLYIRNWVCPKCGSEHDREVNSVKNLLDWAHGNSEEHDPEN